MYFARVKALFIGFMAAFIMSGCSTMSNQELRDAISAKGFKTAERDQGVIVFFPGVLFEYDKYDLTPEAVSRVNDLATIINEPSVVDRNLLVEGHTDSSGSDEYNMKLSENRAQTVYSELVKDKVNADRMTVKGYGETKPLADNNNPDGTPNPENQAANRRVEIIIKNLDAQ